MEWWSGGVVEWWSGGVVEGWSGGVVEWWSGGVVEWWKTTRGNTKKQVAGSFYRRFRKFSFRAACHVKAENAGRSSFRPRPNFGLTYRMRGKSSARLKVVGIILVLIVVLIGIAIGLAPRREIVTSIEISAPPDRVWAILTDTKRYAEWNPEIAALNGQLVPGRVLENRQGYGDEQQVFWPTVLVVDPNRELRWAGRMWAPRLFDVEHYFLLSSVGERGTRFTQGENFRGVALWFFDVNQLTPGFNAMNVALKSRAEHE